jgi:DNA-binding transcriptional MerR regulator
VNAQESGDAFTAGEVREAAGLSYRQLNDWDHRGVLPRQPGRGEGWRRFSPRDLFALMVCAELRRQFGVPVERLRFVREFMLQENANHLKAAIWLMQVLGLGVWLVTDFEETFMMDSELEFMDMIEHGWLGGGETRAYAWLKVDPLVNKLLGALKDPINIVMDRSKGAAIMRLRDQLASGRSPEEVEVLRLIRSGQFETVEVKLKDGKISTIHTTDDLDERMVATLEKVIERDAFQTFTVTAKDGRIVSARRKTSHKPQQNDAKKGTRRRRAEDAPHATP